MKKLTDLKIIRHLNIAFIAAIMIALVPAGCLAAQTSAGKTLPSRYFALQWIDKAQAGGRTEQLTLQHPLPISEWQMVLQMVALNYESYSPLSKARPVFTKEDIQKTKRLLTKALNKAHPQNIIGFEVDSKAGTIRGQLFASGGNLHWRFFEIQGVQFSVTRNESARYGTAWQMAPKKGQKFHETDKLKGTLQWLNWIEAKINLPAPRNLKTAQPEKDPSNSGTAQFAPPLSQPSLPKTIAPEKNANNLEEILKALKNLYDNQFMDKQEYELKRQILIQYF